MSSGLTTEDVTARCYPRPIKRWTQENRKRIRIHTLVPCAAFTMLVVLVAVSALAPLLVGVSIIRFLRSQTVPDLRVCWIPQLLCPHLEGRVDLGAVEVVTVELGGVAVFDNS